MADNDTVALLAQVPTATLSGLLYKKHGFRRRAIARVAPLDPNTCRFAGPAYTIRYVPQREDLNVATDLGQPDSLLLRAMEELRRGDVFVIDMQGDDSVGALGDVLVAHLLTVGIAGVVADGGMRDVRETRQMGLPIFCRGPAAPPGPAALMPAGVQELIGCGGVAVFPGDFVVGDEDGVVVVPAHVAREVAEAGIEKERQDGWSRQMVSDGAGVRGRYPPDAARLEQYKRWREQQG